MNGKQLEFNLCKSCAEDKGMQNPLSSNLSQLFGNFITDLLDSGVMKMEDKSRLNIECKGCGLTWEAFENTGLFGCDLCYQTFQNDLDIILKKIHGSNKHIGSRPQALRSKIDERELQRIKVELKTAIKNEDFELAAELRDVVRDAERELQKTQNDGILR